MAKHERSGSGQLRIIGGSWRGRKIAVSDREALRPTPNRVRETLFNWLGPGIEHARCVDLFAGSGALGIEALSRGAASCEFIELDPGAARHLEQQLQTLSSDRSRYRVITGDAFALSPPREPWHVVFIDPPFAAECVHEVLAHLSQPGFLSEDADIYVETAADDPSLDAIPSGFELRRDKRAGDVRYALLSPS